MLNKIISINTSGVSGNRATKDVVIIDPLGIHARPGSDLVKLASTFQNKIIITANGKKIDPKSILQMLTIAAGKGDTLTITVLGADAGDVLNKLIEHLEREKII